MTTPTSLDLLRRLGSGVRPDGAGGVTPRPASLTQGASFADLLRAAKGGEIETGRSLRLAEGVVGAELSAGQLDRLSQATDRAEASGATRLLALIDGKAVTIDVTTRTALSVADAAAEGRAPVMTGIDSVVIVPGAGGGAGGAGAEAAHAAPRVRGLASNAALARLLAGK